MIRERLLNKTIYRWAEIDAKNIVATSMNCSAFYDIKNICEGKKDVVVCGAGPTLQQYVPIENAIHIALNRAFLYNNVKFDYIYAQDYDGIKMIIQELIDYKGNNCVKFLAKYSPNDKEIPENIIIKAKAKPFVTDSYIYQNGYRSKYIIDIDKMAIGAMPNVGLGAMQLALFMNPRKLYIVGCDMSGTHFSDKNQSQQEIKSEKKQYDAYWNKDMKLLLNKWQEFKQFANKHYPETEIIAVNPVGLRGMFTDLDQ